MPRFELPEFCFGVLPTNDEVILIKRDVLGYWPYNGGQYKGEEVAKELNESLGVTPAQAQAMLNGSIFGWNIPAAMPYNYDENGRLK